METVAKKTKDGLALYFSKWTGEEKAGPGKIAAPLFIALTTLGGFAALGIVSAITEMSLDLTQDGHAWLVMVGSYGATMVLVFAAPAGPFSQPRNVVIGNVFSSLIGVGCRVWIAQPMGNYSFALPFGVALSYVVMHLTRTVNPPAGGTAAIAVIGSPSIDRVGWALVIPATLWGIIFVIIACIFINLVPGHRYPRYWFVDHSVYRDIRDKCCPCCKCGKGEDKITEKNLVDTTPSSIKAEGGETNKPSTMPPSPRLLERIGSEIKSEIEKELKKEEEYARSISNQPLTGSIQNRDDEGCVIGDEDHEEDEVLPDGHVKRLVSNPGSSSPRTSHLDVEAQMNVRPSTEATGLAGEIAPASSTTLNLV